MHFDASVIRDVILRRVEPFSYLEILTLIFILRKAVSCNFSHRMFCSFSGIILDGLMWRRIILLLLFLQQDLETDERIR